MRKLLLFAMMLPMISFGQQSHTLTGFDFGFNPDTLYISAGDTVNFINQGYHSVTECDSTDWANNQGNSNGGFYVGFGAPTSDLWFTVDNPGKYYYICVPHAGMGMKGVIYVDPVSSIPAHQDPQLNKISVNMNNQLDVQYKDNDELKVYDLSGKVLVDMSLADNGVRTTVSTDLPAGVYVVTLSKGGDTSVAQKVYLR